MGNEQSRLPGIQIDDEAIEVSNFWTQHSATISEANAFTNLTVFIEDSSLYTSQSLWSSQTPLQICTKYLMVFRHPCIVKYVGSWNKNSKLYLVIEDVMPLHQVLPFLNNSQISVGLYSVLKALSFLHENATASHNNISISAIYVSKDGTWKLGGMEYLCKYKDLTSKHLEQYKNSRYNKAIDENEGKQLQSNRKDFIDVYAFGVLVNELLKTEDNDDSIREFCDYCKNELQNCEVSKRPNIKSVLAHPFFSQDFILTYSFLIELPLKNNAEKNEFFQNLGEKLKAFNEKLVASQLSGLLLSRMVLSNATAQKDLLPYLLSPQIDVSGEEELSCLFTRETFEEHIVPKLIELFKVHEVQTRMLLLQFLPKFVSAFTKDELQKNILPELLVGMKDTNDELVTATLRALAVLVPFLGSAIVIGGKRAKLFNDGRPNDIRTISRTKRTSQTQTRTVQHVIESASVIEINNLSVPSVRPRPDGEEGSDSQEILQSTEEDLEKWDDWNTNENVDNLEEDILVMETDDVLESQTDDLIVPTMKIDPNSTKQANNKSIPDISELDIKNQVHSNDDDIDFFEDMEPVINKSNKFLIDEQNDKRMEKEINSKLAFANNDNNEEGWEDGWE